MKAKKSLGQNFLIDNSVIKNISNQIDSLENDLIIEIGPGIGALTKELKKKKCNILAYELDKDLKKYLDILEDEKLQIKYEDILKANIQEDIKKYNYNRLFIVGNLPYYITTPIIKHLIEMNLEVYQMIFMVQDEVANRFTSEPCSKNYGSITLYLNYYFEVSKIFKVSKYSFSPNPKVESAIIKFSLRKNRPLVNTELYFKLINDAFSMKRKTLKNNLKSYNFEKILIILKENGYAENCRAEELPEKIYLEICNKVLEDF